MTTVLILISALAISNFFVALLIGRDWGSAFGRSFDQALGVVFAYYFLKAIP